MIDLKILGLLEHIFRYCRVSFPDLLFKNQEAMISQEAVTLRIISKNCRLALVINAHLPIDEACREYSSYHKDF